MPHGSLIRLIYVSTLKGLNFSPTTPGGRYSNRTNLKHISQETEREDCPITSGVEDELHNWQLMISVVRYSLRRLRNIPVIRPVFEQLRKALRDAYKATFNPNVRQWS